MIESLRALYHRELDQLSSEITQYPDEASIWLVAPGIANSAGNLALHIVGNLNTFLGVPLAKTDYVRDREFEFGGKDVPREQLVKMINSLKDILDKGFDSIKDEDLSEVFPIKIWPEEKTIEFALLRLLSHASYHLGQVNYHRRLVANIS